MAKDTPMARINIIARSCGFQHKKLPITYLGAPLFSGCPSLLIFENLLVKIRQKVVGWRSKLLSQGGRLVLIRHVLSSMPIYLLSAMHFPTSIIKDSERIFSDFFWGDSNGKKRRKWIAWESICCPCSEGGLNIRSVTNVMKSFRIKQAWAIFTSDSLWARFMILKYVKSTHLSQVQFHTGCSNLWWHILKVFPFIFDNSCWVIGRGEVDLLFDNWLGSGTLCSVFPPSQPPVRTVSVQEGFDSDFQVDGISSTMRDFICRNIAVSSIRLRDDPDNFIWKPATDGKFSVKSAYNICRLRRPYQSWWKLIWFKRVPIKISVFSWKLVHSVVSVDSVIQACDVHLASWCHCCEHHQVESLHHLFISGNFARLVWRHFEDVFCIPTRNFNTVSQGWESTVAVA
ncbi:hypothetical protein L1049_002255 [Liquidambar formosana]|uniref:Reverse transcriptase zinc-binding domain-containing protein n=1 Tax=Liquidambar formosana TaxID=63359 RepID=A0AAP0R798_LIQFO